MNATYRNAIATHGGTLVTHIGLVDAGGTEITGGSPAYARRAVTWAAPNDGTIRPNANLVYDIPAGATVAGWRGFSASTGGTSYGGEALTPETFAAQGEYTLLAALTGIRHDEAA
jgi:hypothetical protein